MFRALVSLIALIGLSNPTLAQGNDPAEDPFQRQFEDMVERLVLTEPQRTELEPILRGHFLELQTLLEKHDLDRRRSNRPDRRALLAFRSDAQALNETTDAQVEAILSPVQIETYRDIQDERRARLRAQLRR